MVQHGKRSPGCSCEHMSLNDHVLNELLDDDTNTCTILFQNNKGTLVFCSLVKDNHGIVFYATISSIAVKPVPSIS